jgi:hypothetical protein
VPQQFVEEHRAEVRQVDPVMGNNYNNQNAYLDPMIGIFKKAKMNTDFKISIDINKKIPKLAYIELMEESCDTSIIEYLANEFTDSILRNPEFIKNKIMEEIRNMIEPKPKNKVKINEMEVGLDLTKEPKIEFTKEEIEKYKIITNPKPKRNTSKKPTVVKEEVPEKKTK